MASAGVSECRPVCASLCPALMSASVCVCVSPLQAIAVVRYVHQSFNERTGLSRNVGGLPTVVVFCWHSSVLRHGDEKSNRSKMTGVL